jgi:hypothetical protein
MSITMHRKALVSADTMAIDAVFFDFSCDLTRGMTINLLIHEPRQFIYDDLRLGRDRPPADLRDGDAQTALPLAAQWTPGG